MKIILFSGKKRLVKQEKKKKHLSKLKMYFFFQELSSKAMQRDDKLANEAGG